MIHIIKIDESQRIAEKLETHHQALSCSQAMKPLKILEPSSTPQTGCAKINSCRNRFEVVADWGMSSTEMAKWAHEAMDRWLRERMDLSTASGHNSGNPAQKR